jgi:hypothetical protein
VGTFTIAYATPTMQMVASVPMPNAASTIFQEGT